MSELFLKIINMSISASWLVLAVLALRLAFKKAPKWVNVLLWGIVAVRLICPISIESALSLIPSAETIPLDIGMDTTPAINSGVESFNSVVNPIISQSNTPVAGASVNPLQITIGIYEQIWLLGVVVLLLYTAVSYWRLRRKVTLTDDGHGGYGLVNHFKREGDDLIFIAEDSANFVYVKVQDGERFHRTGEAFKQADTPAQLGGNQTLSLNDVIMLSQKGYDLTWSDFDQYKYIETGSGLYIRVYEINEMYELWIGGGWTDEDPMYIYLALADDLDTRIDIRDGGVTEFIGADHSEVLLAKAINEAILDHFKASKPDGLLHCASFVSLAQQELCIDSEPASPMQVTVYGMALHEKYGYSGATFHTVESWYNPVKLTFEKTPNGAFRLSDAWFPKYPAESAEQHGNDIYEQFSMHSEDLANSVLFELLDYNYLAQLKQECYDQAVRYGGVDTNSVVESLFEVIESSPATSSRPADYIDAHPIEYRELMYYGDYTLQ